MKEKRERESETSLTCSLRIAPLYHSNTLINMATTYSKLTVNKKKTKKHSSQELTFGGQAALNSEVITRKLVPL